MLKSRKKLKKGITLYLTIIILSLLFAIGIGLSLIVFAQIKIARNVGYSVNALCIADSGVEKALYGIYKEGWSLGTSSSDSIDGNIFTIQIYPPSGCASGTQYYCIISQGNFKNTLRTIQAAY